MENNSIGLSVKKSALLSSKLNQLLAEYQVFYMNVRGFHWNIKGDKFFELHLKFEELYNDLILKIDEIAERILTLGHTPVHSYSEYLKAASIQEKMLITNGTQAVNSILEAFQVILINQRELLLLSADANDEGTNSLMSDYIKQQEKLVWMYSAYLNNN
ncbi:MAG: Dps family protein [Melioribacteraceae bacterium]